jgi:hypothetical protein
LKNIGEAAANSTPKPLRSVRAAPRVSALLPES